MSFSERVAAEIRAEMARQRRSAHSLEVQLGWSHLYLTRRLNGRSALKLDDIEAIAAALEVPVTAFFGFPVYDGVTGQLRKQPLAMAA
jgi:transcriptional regulator with XRE-family HTH domain